MLSLNNITTSRWRKCRTVLSFSLPDTLASCLPTLDRIWRLVECQPPKVSTAITTNSRPSLLEHSWYVLVFTFCTFCSTAFFPSPATWLTRAVCRVLATVTYSAEALPRVQHGRRISAGRLSEPGRIPSGSLRGPTCACWADWKIAFLKWLCREIRSPSIEQLMA